MISKLVNDILDPTWRGEAGHARKDRNGIKDHTRLDSDLRNVQKLQLSKWNQRRYCVPQIDNAGQETELIAFRYVVVRSRGEVAVGASNDARNDSKCMPDVNKLENVRIPWQWFR